MTTVTDQYVGSLAEFSSLALQKLPSERFIAKRIPAPRLFLAHYAAFPCASTCPKVESNAWLHIPSILTYLQDRFAHDLTNDIISRDYHIKSKQFFVTYVLN